MARSWLEVLGAGVAQKTEEKRAKEEEAAKQQQMQQALTQLLVGAPKFEPQASFGPAQTKLQGGDTINWQAQPGSNDPTARVGAVKPTFPNAMMDPARAQAYAQLGAQNPNIAAGLISSTLPKKDSWQVIGDKTTGYYRVNPATGEKERIVEGAAGSGGADWGNSLKGRAIEIMRTNPKGSYAYEMAKQILTQGTSYTDPQTNLRFDNPGLDVSAALSALEAGQPITQGGGQAAPPPGAVETSRVRAPGMETYEDAGFPPYVIDAMENNGGTLPTPLANKRTAITLEDAWPYLNDEQRKLYQDEGAASGDMDVLGAAGWSGFWKKIGNAAAGLTGRDELPFPEVDLARKEIKTLSTQMTGIETANMQSGRPSNYVIGLAQEIANIPIDSLIRGDAGVKNDLRRTESRLKQAVGEYNELRKTPEIGSTKRQEYEELYQRTQNVLDRVQNITTGIREGDKKAAPTLSAGDTAAYEALPDGAPYKVDGKLYYKGQ